MSEHQPSGIAPADEARHDDPAETVAPTVDKSAATKCPACNIGVLFVIADDPDALHEIGNAAASDHPAFSPSGGSQIVHCFHCGYQASQPLGEGGAS